MHISRLAFVLAALSAASCIDKDVDNTEFYEKYARGFDNRTTVAVNIASEVAGEYYAVYFGNPYDGESLVKQPALTGFTPVSTTLDVPKDVERLYVVIVHTSGHRQTPQQKNHYFQFQTFHFLFFKELITSSSINSICTHPRVPAVAGTLNIVIPEPSVFGT